MTQTQKTHRFSDGDTIHDIDGNTYDVIGNYAELRNSSIRYNLNTHETCFCYLNEFERVPFSLRAAAEAFLAAADAAA